MGDTTRWPGPRARRPIRPARGAAHDCGVDVVQHGRGRTVLWLLQRQRAGRGITLDGTILEGTTHDRTIPEGTHARTALEGTAPVGLTHHGLPDLYRSGLDLLTGGTEAVPEVLGPPLRAPARMRSGCDCPAAVCSAERGRRCAGSHC